MADSTVGDSEVEDLDFLATAVFALITGLLIHSYISGINVIDWSKGRLLTPVDHIVAFLGITRIGIQCADVFYFFNSKQLVRSPNSYISLEIVNSVYYFFNYVNVWLTTLLLTVLCVKVSSLRIRLFLYLRRMIVHRTGHFIVASGLLSALNSFTPLWSEVSEVTSGGPRNTTMENQLKACINLNSIINSIIGSLVPLIFYIISSILLFTTLYHHTVQMKKSSNLSINLETYYSAMKLVFFTFIYNTVYLTGHIVFSYYYYFFCVIFTWPYVFLDFLPVLHSSYLIYNTSKLRSPLYKILQNVTDFLFQCKDAKAKHGDGEQKSRSSNAIGWVINVSQLLAQNLHKLTSRRVNNVSEAH